MAQKIAGGAGRLAISIATVMLQALANANRAGRIPHVFGTVTSPVGAGELALKLLEAPIEHTKDVRVAAESLVSRGAEAFWTGGDASVGNAVNS